MPIENPRASYILRLIQRLSRLSFELRDLRTGRSHRFANAHQLAGFLDAVTEHHSAVAQQRDSVERVRNVDGTALEHPDDAGDTR